MSLLLRPLDPSNPPPSLSPEPELRGIALHWRDAATILPATTTRRRARKKADPSAYRLPPTAYPSWQTQRVAFHAVSASGEDDPPRDAAQQERYVRAAYALAACSWPIPSDAEILYEMSP